MKEGVAAAVVVVEVVAVLSILRNLLPLSLLMLFVRGGCLLCALICLLSLLLVFAVLLRSEVRETVVVDAHVAGVYGMSEHEEERVRARNLDSYYNLHIVMSSACKWNYMM